MIFLIKIQNFTTVVSETICLDGQTDRRTDGQIDGNGIPIFSSSKGEMKGGENVKVESRPTDLLTLGK